MHVNIALIVKFMASYFFNPAEYPPVPQRNEAVNDDFDVMNLVSIDLQPVCDFANGSIRSHPHESIFQDLFEQFPIVTFAAFHNRSKELYLRTGRKLLDGVDDLIDCLALDFPTATVAELCPYSGEE